MPELMTPRCMGRSPGVRFPSDALGSVYSQTVLRAARPKPLTAAPLGDDDTDALPGPGYRAPAPCREEVHHARVDRRQHRLGAGLPGPRGRRPWRRLVEHAQTLL